MEASIEWKGDFCFESHSGSGHTVVMDGPPEHGGANQGPRPMEMLLLGMGGCTAFDVVQILNKGRAGLSDFNIELKAERAGEDPKVFTKIHVHFRLKGDNIKEALVKRAIELSAEKYCSASIMLGETADITHSFEIME
ncbi:MAG: OsmC family protein [Hyphomicrobiales bacterium]|nr:MAG: OsmC family protein [Hyphomicrobiales bacterium]